MVRKSRTPIGVLALEFYKHQSNYVIAVYEMKLAEDVDDYDAVTVYDAEARKHSHKMQAVMDVIRSMSYSLESLDYELKTLDTISNGKYKTLALEFDEEIS